MRRAGADDHEGRQLVRGLLFRLRRGVVRFGSVCSGIEAATVAWRPLGWQSAFFSEIGNFPSAVLAHHYPDVANLGDLNAFAKWPDFSIDVLAGGTPCQSFSVAGLRAGIDDPRGQLSLSYLRCAARYRPRWVVWENVPGVLSADGGRAFGAFLGGLADIGYGWAYRILDAQHFRLAQRRRRVWVVGHLGRWSPAAAVLFELASLRGDSPASSETRKGCASPLAASSDGSGGYRNDADTVANLIPVAGTVSSKWRKGSGGPAGDECYNLVPFDTTQLTHPENRSNPQPGDPAPSLAARASPPAIAFNARQDPISDSVTMPLDTDGTSNGVHHNQVVRRLTPLECERLQGFPDNYTRIPMPGKPGRVASDGARYHALGNSWPTNVAHWIGQRIDLVELLADLLPGRTPPL
jgi:DNA (cytosine-5)-methyltransferase 1